MENCSSRVSARRHCLVLYLFSTALPTAPPAGSESVHAQNRAAVVLGPVDCSRVLSESLCTCGQTSRPMLRLDNGNGQGRGCREVARLPSIFLAASRRPLR